MNTTPKPKLYALIVGINDYRADLILQGQIRFPALGGCVMDALKVQRYLKNDPAFEPHVLLLQDRKADKASVVSAFREHLGQAKEGDVALFYFSGHGTQEWADPTVWKHETDGRLECLACHYDEQTASDFLLADKELRYLIQQLSAKKPHVVTIFDCCHSGDNTRNGALVQTVFKDEAPREKRIPFAFAKRPWEQFIFGQTIAADTIRQQGDAVALPEGTHVQLSACESDESAVEVSGEGVFTKTLLTVLRASAGDLSYYTLRSRVRQYLRNVYEQKPRIYVANGDDSLLHTTFLNRPGQRGQSAIGEVTYNRKTGWQLNLGAIHGITMETKTITVFNPDDPGQKYSAQPGLIRVDSTQLRFEPSVNLNQNAVFQATIDGLMMLPLPITLKNRGGLLEDQQTLLDKLSNESGGLIVTEEREELAKYVVHDQDGRYYITYPNDPYRPLTNVIETASETAIPELVEQLKHLSRWEFMNNLTNSGTNQLPGKPLTVEFARIGADGQTTAIFPENDLLPIHYEKQANGRWQSNLQVKITNPVSNQRSMYCSALYLSSTFESFTGFLNPKAYLLEPGNSVCLGLNRQDYLPATLQDTMRFYNWPTRLEHIKLIVSTDEFDPQALTLATLPDPPLPGDENRGGNRGSFATDDRSIQLTGWTTQSYTLKLVNPEPNVILDTELNAMLHDPVTTPFALGIYFDAHPGTNWETDYQLKPDIEVLDSAHLDERGLISDLGLAAANTLANRLRNRQYAQVTKRFPNRVRLVSEGDSWFQHPLVTDTIDHLSRAFAIYCVAAAGDTLRNYQKTGEYLDAIDEQNPAFFLISGGGNDILGDQFRTFLKANPDMSEPPGQNPRRFLNDKVFAELDALRDLYKAMFGHLKIYKPNLQILVHGYDYVIPLQVTNKGWLGRYMIEIGINRQEDRFATIQFILDEFNSRIKTVAEAFENVSYLDLRKTVRPDQWYDEIHPNSDGYQQVAMKFMERINVVLAKHPDLAQPLNQSRGEDFFFPLSGRGQVVASENQKPQSQPRTVIGSAAPEKVRGANRITINLENVEYETAPSRSSHIPSPAFMPPPAPPVTSPAEAKPTHSPLREGQLDYDIPGSMKVNSQTTCTVRIAGKEVEAALLKISEGSVHQDIIIGNEMSVRLVDSSGGEYFKITTISTERQEIWTGDDTQWKFFVRPLKAGRHPLLLQITVHLGNRSRDLDVLEKEVLISSDDLAVPTPDTKAWKRILFLSANPMTHEPLRLGAEAREIQEELRGSDGILFSTSLAVTPRTLTRSILQEKPTIVHFSGHGTDQGLCLETESGQLKTVSAEALGRLFAVFDDSVQCVLLNACYSETQARAIGQHIPYVIGMQRSIGDEAAIAFSATFYQALGSGLSIVDAYELAVAGMGLEDNRQAAIPVLLKKNPVSGRRP
ncbi:caspase family protein [Larkinella punicea]|uniref:CHAT domain-containing protein n=1 Tax=Larkinella punicea TaxID=2315727 RepID=A0A368JX75_9BACT|nr:caspase family protein [Larkinella punicea]RCR71546.1 CHAT domain-containing protein [Larkinella punicea]